MAMARRSLISGLNSSAAVELNDCWSAVSPSSVLAWVLWSQMRCANWSSMWT